MSWERGTASLAATVALALAGCSTDDLDAAKEAADALEEREEIRKDALKTNRQLQRRGRRLLEKSRRDGVDPGATKEFFKGAAGQGKRIAKDAERNQRRLENAAP